MKHKLLSGIVVALCLATSSSVFLTNDVQAEHFRRPSDGTLVDKQNNTVTLHHSHSYWNKWRKVVLTQNTTFANYPKKADLYASPTPTLQMRLKRGTVFYVKNANDEDGIYWSIKGKDFKQSSDKFWTFDDGKVDEVYGPGFDLATAKNVKKYNIDPVHPTPITTTKKIKVIKEKMAKYNYKVRPVGKRKTIKKGTKMSIIPGGMDFNWIMIKKGYTHSGLRKTHGYIWVVEKIYTDNSWFKLRNQNKSNVIKTWYSKD